jgi:monofunctional biosynthetic peptidoglycan transglycosylase
VQKNPKVKAFFRKVLYVMLFTVSALLASSVFYALYLRWFPPVTTHLMLIRAMETHTKDNWELVAKWKSYDNISDNAKIAVIASEDQRFASHFGFDFEAIEKAYKANRKSKKTRGGSTISQQVAKNVFLWPQRSYMRKGMEVYFTFLIETLWPKERILEMYLNVAEMGDGIFGIQAASRKYFHKDSGYLTAAESALIAACLPNPRKFIASKPSAFIIKKQNHILRYMRTIGGKNYLKHME